MENEIYIGILAACVVFFYLLLRKKGISAGRRYEQEIEKILTSDEHKVKGRFE